MAPRVTMLLTLCHSRHKSLDALVVQSGHSPDFQYGTDFLRCKLETICSE